MNSLNETIMTTRKEKTTVAESSTVTSNTITTIESFLTLKEQVPTNGAEVIKLGIVASSEVGPTMRIKVPKGIDVFSPVISECSFNPDEHKITIKLTTMVYAKKLETVVLNALYYDYSLDIGGTPKIVLYFDFKSTPSMQDQDGIVCEEYIITFTQKNEIPLIYLNTINNVETFMIEEDPRTSRGVVTTVKPTTSKKPGYAY